MSLTFHTQNHQTVTASMDMFPGPSMRIVQDDYDQAVAAGKALWAKAAVECGTNLEVLCMCTNPNTRGTPLCTWVALPEIPTCRKI